MVLSIPMVITLRVRQFAQTVIVLKAKLFVLKLTAQLPVKIVCPCQLKMTTAVQLDMIAVSISNCYQTSFNNHALVCLRLRIHSIQI